MTVAAASVVVLTLLSATIFELESAQRFAKKDAVAEARLKDIEAESLRQQTELMDTLSRLAYSQTPAEALETNRRALASARAFEFAHPNLREGAVFVAGAALDIGDAIPDQAIDRYTEARTRLEPFADAYPALYFKSLLGLGRAQLKNRDVLGALASFSRALQIAEGHGESRDIASSNFWVGTVLAYNGETEAGTAKLRKAFELYRDLVGGPIRTAEDSPAGYRKALADLAALAPPDLRQAMEAQLRESAPVNAG